MKPIFTDLIPDDSKPAELFNDGSNNVNFNTVFKHSYLAGSQYDAGAGNDTVTLPETAYIAQLAGYNPGNALHLGEGNDTVYGGGINATVYGDGGTDFMIGGSGNERFYGGLGDDYLISGGGNNYLDGGAGEDNIYSQHGSNILVGGAGYDQFYISETVYTSANADRIMDFNPYQDSVKFYVTDFAAYNGAHIGDYFKIADTATGLAIQVDADGDGNGAAQIAAILNGLHGNAFDLAKIVTIQDYGSGAHDYHGGGNRDEITSSGNASITVHAEDGADYINFLNATGADTIYAGDGDDTIMAGGGADIIDSGAGSDGINLMYGFGGDHAQDKVIISAHDIGTGVDYITGFETGIDKLVLTDLLDFNGNIAQFAKLASDAFGGVNLSIDIDGSGTHYGWQTAAHFYSGFGSTVPKISDITVA